MIHRGLLLMLSAFLITVSVAAARAETRVAFVVGNSAYENAPRLANPVRDARLVSDTLSALGFDVTRYSDLTRDGFADALSRFLRKSKDADVTFFYYAGHGMQYDGENYLIGTNAELRSELDIDGEAIALGKVVELLERNSKAALVFVDACRDNPLATDFYRRNFSETRALQTRGLARMQSRPDGAMVMFAAAPGEVAFDGDGLNSPFAASLARHLPTENIEILSLTKRITRDVREETDGRQSPIVTNDMTREIFLREAALRPSGDTASDAFEAEQSVFDAAEKTGTLHAWARYFAMYPKGRLSSLALAAEHEVLMREASYLAAGFEAPTPLESISGSLASRFEARLGIDREDVIAVQALLKRENFYAGTLDGVAGPATRTAITAFQSARELPETGMITRATAQALGLSLSKLSDRPAFSSFRKAGIHREHAETLGMDPRLFVHASNTANWAMMIYGYRGDRLYIATDDFWAASKFHPGVVRAGAKVYPVSVGSADENRFIYDLVRYERSYWFVGRGDGWLHGPMIGLWQPRDAQEPSSGWTFVGDEDSAFRRWDRGQPDNYKGTQDYARIWLPESALNGTPDLPSGPNWDDTTNFHRPIILEVE